MFININKNRVIYITIIILFLVYLFNANNIISSFFRDTVTKTDLTSYQTKDFVNYSVDEFAEYGGLLEKISFKGWAFCETSAMNNQKKISLVFVSDNNVYEFTDKVSNRYELYKAFNGSKKIQGTKHGFVWEFSTIPMRNGIYELYIYCRENDQNYGFVKTDKLYKKDVNGFKEYTWISSKIKKSLTTDATIQNVNSSIDKFEVMEDDSINIIGWAFLNEKDCLNQKVYLEITDSGGITVTYNTKLMERRDVGDVFKSSKYNQSGFSALIPSGDLEKGEATIRIYIENNGTIYGPSIDYNLTI